MTGRVSRLGSLVVFVVLAVCAGAVGACGSTGGPTSAGDGVVPTPGSGTTPGESHVAATTPGRAASAGVSILVSDVFVIGSNPDRRGLPWNPSFEGDVVVVQVVNTTTATVHTDGRFRIERQQGGRWVPAYQTSFTAASNGTTVWVPADAPAPGAPIDLSIGPSGSTSGYPPETLSVPSLDPGTYRIEAAITGGPVERAYGMLYVGDPTGAVPGGGATVPPAEAPDAEVAGAPNEYVPETRTIGVAVMNRSAGTIHGTGDATLEQWKDGAWQPTHHLHGSVERRLCSDTECGTITVRLPDAGSARPPTFEGIDEPAYVPSVEFDEPSHLSIISETFTLPVLATGRYRISQKATTADGRAIDVHTRFQRLRDDVEVAPTTSVGAYELVEVTAPITQGLQNRPDLHEHLDPPHPDDKRPIPAAEIIKRNPPRGGTSKLYFGRYSIDVPSIAGVPEFADRPVWIIVTDERSREACMLPGGGPAPMPGGTTTTTAPHDCSLHTVTPIDPMSGAALFTSMSGG